MLKLETNTLAFEEINPETIKLHFSCKANKESYSLLYGRNISAIIDQYQIEGNIDQNGLFNNEIIIPKKILNNKLSLTLSIQGIRKNIIIQIGSLIPQSILNNDKKSIQNLNKQIEAQREVIHNISHLHKKANQTLTYSESIHTKEKLNTISHSLHLIQKEYLNAFSPGKKC